MRAKVGSRRATIAAMALVAVAGLCRFAGGQEGSVRKGSLSPHIKLRSVSLKDVRWTGGFWGGRYDQCRRVVTPNLWRVMQLPDNAATFNDLKMAGGLAAKADPGGTKWSDGDCHKCIETMAHLFEVSGDTELDRLMDEAIEWVAKAQQADGYLSSWVQLKGVDRWEHLNNHEFYNMGHLMTAACMHHRATGKDSYLKIATRVGDYLYDVFAPRPKELAHFGFNPSNIMGAVDLYRTTRNPKYLKLAGIFIDMRGSQPGGSNQNQAAVPLRKEKEAVGHCVTATYLWCGAADVYAETGEEALLDALNRLWHDVTTHKMYVTGGVAALHHGELLRRTFRRWPRDSVHEAFGAEYQLPNRTAYNETCANIGNAMWNWRMLGLTGDAKYTDVMERVLYNSMTSAIGLSGTDFFYTNPLRRCGPDVPLLSNDSAARWPDTTPKSSVHCFCCPPNVSRTLAKLQGWAYSVSDDSVWVNLYSSSHLETKLPNGSAVSLAQKTDYPWDGKITIEIQQAASDPMALILRVPGWATDAALQINGKPSNVELTPGTYAAIRRQWSAGDVVELDLPMDVVFLRAHPLIEEARNQVAVMRGPIVYCLESPDLPEGVGVDDVAIVAGAKWTPRRDKDLLDRAAVLDGEAHVKQPPDWTDRLYQRWEPASEKRIRVTLIPYYAWANRGISQMTVWLSTR
ncbi:MAG: glycoside hydrolase family 127 protein [Planctomycetes bacterium]|nr:glycoside hydrolase family 127 protein [Planctomycetota bacterium]MBL7038341.1 glycoside hydrolase family 127 protein [Pirellulaceae bacterium]